MNGRGVKVRPARPGVKPANRQLKASVGDKVPMFARSSAPAAESSSLLKSGCFSPTVDAVPHLSVAADGNAQRHHPALRALHQAQ